MDLPVYKSNEELPLTMTAKDVAGYLNISLTCAYYVMNSADFPVLKIGKRLLITKDNFLKWLENSNNREVIL
jgi:hypothetical protein